MSGRQPFMVKLMTIFIGWDKMVGREFEKGLKKWPQLLTGPAHELPVADQRRC